MSYDKNNKNITLVFVSTLCIVLSYILFSGKYAHISWELHSKLI